jgi:hypothetical protein
MTTITFEKKYIIRKETKKSSFYELAKKHIIKWANKNSTLSLEIDKIAYDL